MTQVGILQSVQVGKPAWRQVSEGVEKTKRWKTSFVRVPSSEPRWLYRTHLEGNEQADKKHHGSLDQAVLLYAAQHYPAWQAELERPEIGSGGFGENFTVEGLSEETACIGDTYAIGEARIQVSGPRYPCWKIERRWGIAGLTDRAAGTGRTGWYCRVVQEGMIQPGAPILLVERPYPDWTIALTNDFVHGRNHDAEKARALAACPLLNEFWQQLVVKRVKEKA
ncbi:MAG TPA: MOSC domain-containing protein [Ktedonobacteraceae bacterium]|nr:MOSC domain-containing protein [Ktedonobacteraceae bacterium]